MKKAHGGRAQHKAVDELSETESEDGGFHRQLQKRDESSKKDHIFKITKEIRKLKKHVNAF